MRAILIPADPQGAIEEIDSGTLADLQRRVGGLIEGVAFPGEPAAIGYVNESGVLDGLRRNERATRLLRPTGIPAGEWLAGDCVLVGFNRNTGGHMPLPAHIGKGI